MNATSPAPIAEPHATLRRRLIRLDTELDIGSTTVIPAAEVRADTYSWFSLFSHVNFVAHFVSAHPAPLGDREAAGAPLGMLGEAGEMARSTFARALLYIWLFFCHFNRLLWERHRWGRFRGERWRGWYRYRAQAFDTLFRQNYRQLQGIAHEDS
jgi:hypothetical protein